MGWDKFKTLYPDQYKIALKKHYGSVAGAPAGLQSGGFVPNFFSRERWISDITDGKEIGSSLCLGKGGTDTRATMPQLSKEAQKIFESDLANGTGLAGQMTGG